MDDFSRFVDDYYARFTAVLQRIDAGTLQRIMDVFRHVARRGGTIWVAGNGGSAAIADHTACDMTKGTYSEGALPVRCVSLGANGPLLTAIANDVRYDQVFRHQLVLYLQPRDAVLVVSASGNSPNVVEACRYAKEQGVPTIAFVGFAGGELARQADHVVWIQMDNYGIVEDAHQSVMHVLTQYMRTHPEPASPPGPEAD
jgi:D-sedoheptulose 7-phosphate isomerase